MTITEHYVQLAGMGLGYLQSGPDDGPAIIFVHGWPELSQSWRKVLPCFGALGFRAIAPDLRGYGRSTVFDRTEDYAQELIVGDLIGLIDKLGIAGAVFVGHDWGSGVVWNIASHHPDRCHGVASLAIPYRTIERGLDNIVALVNRDIYPEEEYPWGQWAYQRYYHENFERATAVLGADPYRTIKALFRRSDPIRAGKPAFTALLLKNGGWFGGADVAPDMERDGAVISEEELRVYADSFERNGFFGPDAFYMNDEANLAYANRSVNGGRLDMPVLFINARFDEACEAVESRFGDPMRAYCTDLTEASLPTGHWMAQETPELVNAIVAKWIVTKVPQVWPVAPEAGLFK